MNNFSLAFSVVFPIFFMMSLGYLLRTLHLFNQDFLKQLNNLCFKVFLPLSLFSSIYQSDFRSLFSPWLVGFSVLCIVLLFLILSVIVPLFEKDNRKRGVIIQGSFRCNFILFGLPITASLFGEENTSVTAILLAFIVPLVNVLSVITLETFSEKKSSLKTILLGVMKNPLIIAAAIALCFSISGIHLPYAVEKPIFDIGKIATPLALMVLGGDFRFKSLQHSKKALTWSVLCKLVLMPSIFLPIGIWLGFRGIELTALLAMLASPTAVSSYTMAQSAGSDDELAGQIVVITSLVSVLTLFFWITALKTLQFL